MSGKERLRAGAASGALYRDEQAVLRDEGVAGILHGFGRCVEGALERSVGAGLRGRRRLFRALQQETAQGFADHLGVHARLGANAWADVARNVAED